MDSTQTTRREMLISSELDHPAREMKRHAMRTETEVFTSLLRWAFHDRNLRAIIVNGSRADPSRIPDALSDYDVAVVVSDLDPVRSGDWIEQFGEIMVRWPLNPEPTFDAAWITQLVLFTDHIRIDFQFTNPDIQKIEQSGPYHCVLVDHDGLTESIQGRSVDGATIDPPTAREFAERVNAFWWDIPYVAKALRRGEIDYARFMMESNLRFEKLHPLIRWRIGVVHGPDTDAGIFGRWFDRYLEPEIWEFYLETFSEANPDDQWRAMFAMASFVRLLAQELAAESDFTYPDGVDEAVSEYLRELHSGR